MANLNYRWDDDSSIEEMLNQFELRDNTGKLKYNRLLLKPIRIQEKIYLFDQFIALGRRSKKNKFDSKYGVCKMYKLYGIKIFPAKRGWKNYR